MNIMKAYERADKISSRSDLVAFMEAISKSIASKEFPTLKSYEVMDGCESFTADIHAWCAYRNIPFDEEPTWSLVAWIILAGALND